MTDYRTDVTVTCDECDYVRTRTQVGTRVVMSVVTQAIGHAEIDQHRVDVMFSNTVYKRR